MDDSELIERVRRGDDDAFTRLFARHQRTIFRYAAHMCGREHGDDVVQETFLAVLKQTPQHAAPRGPVVAWLLGIARHLVLKRLGAKYDAATVSADDESLEALPATALDALTRAEAIAAVRTAIASLPAVYREAVVLCDLEDVNYADAAAVLECPVGTVRSRLHRARGLLSARLASLAPAGAGRG